MQYDRRITISAGSNRRAMVWSAQTLLISELWTKLQTPARGTEPLAEYLNMKKAQQDDLKDVGGFLAGALSGPRRKANSVTGCDILKLDLDNIPAGGRGPHTTRSISTISLCRAVRMRMSWQPSGIVRTRTRLSCGR